MFMLNILMSKYNCKENSLNLQIDLVRTYAIPILCF